MFGTGDLGRSFNAATHSDLSPPAKNGEVSSIVLVLFVIVLSLFVVVFMFVARNLAKGVKALFRMLRP